MRNVALLPLFFASIGNAQPLPNSQIPFDPVAASKIIYIGPDGSVIEAYWAALTEPQKRLLLNSAEAFVELRRVDSNGSTALLPLGVTYAKGMYKLLFRWQQYRADYCQAGNPGAGTVRTGVALEIIADITSRRSGLNLANLGALTGAADRDQVQGSITIRQIGLGSSSPTLGTYLSNFQLTREGVTKALEAIAVTKAVLENEKTILTPHYLSKVEATPGSCDAVVPAAVKPRS